MGMINSPGKQEGKKHCEKCSYTTEEGLHISGCAYCGCHSPGREVEWIQDRDTERLISGKNIHSVYHICVKHGVGVDMPLQYECSDCRLYLSGVDIRSLLSKQREEFVEELKKIRDWPEPKEGAGEGLGPLAGTGMYLQYESDSKKHEEEIDAIISKLEKNGRDTK